MTTTHLRYSAEELKKISRKDCAGPDKSFLNPNPNDVKDAWDLAGHVDDSDSVR